MLTTEQKRIIHVIVCIFETGKLPSATAYGTCSILDDDAGITYGIHQTTVKTGNLRLVLQEYCRLAGPEGPHVALIQRWLPKLSLTLTVDPSAIPKDVQQLIEALQSLGGNAQMQLAQEMVFGEQYWEPAMGYATSIGLFEPLSALAIYDCTIHSGISRINKLRSTFPALPPSRGGPERAWTKAFVEARHNWLANFTSSNPRKQALVRKTVYRTQAQLDLMAIGEPGWNLRSPLKVLGFTI